MAVSTRRKHLTREEWNAHAEGVVKDAVKGTLDETKEAPKAKKSAPKKRRTKPTLLFNTPVDEKEDSPPLPPPKAKTPIQVDPPVYSIATSVMWKGKEVRSWLSSSKGFDFHDFTARAVKAVDEKAGKKGYRMVLLSATASLSSSGNQKAMDSTCGDMSEWAKIHTLAMQWLGEKRKGVTVRITHIYGPKPVDSSSDSDSSDTKEPPSKRQKKNKKISDSDSSSSDSATSDDTESSDSDRKKKGKKKGNAPRRTTATTKQEKRAKEKRKLDRKHGAIGHKIMKTTLCEKMGCHGHGHYCWQPDGPSGKHYKLATEQITKWNKAAARNPGDVDEKTPPMKIQEQLKEMWEQGVKANAAAKEAKSAKKKEAVDAPDHAPGPTATPQFSISLNGLGASPSPTPGPQQQQYPYQQQQYLYQQQQQYPYQYQYQQPQFQEYSPYQPMMRAPQYFPSQRYEYTGQNQPAEAAQPSLPSPIKLPSRPTTANQSPPKVRQPPSSPIRVEGDAGELRKAYFAWQIRKNPSEQVVFEEAWKKMETEGYTLKQMRRIPPAEWKEIGIAKGLGARLKDEVKEFVEHLRIRAATNASTVANQQAYTSLDTLAAAAATAYESSDGSGSGEEDEEDEEDEEAE